MNILLVDDEILELEQLELFIRPLHPRWNLYTSVDGFQAVALGKQVRFDLAFIDINLPGRSGLEVARELRITQPSLALVIVTAYQDFQYAKESIKLGVVDYLIKPIIEREIQEILAKYRDSEEIKYSRLIQDVLSILHERYHENMVLNDIAHRVHVNPSYLSRRFREEVKLTFSDYLINYRLERAKTFLATHPDWNIAQVAEETGFNSQHYFSTIFRKKTGFTPREYREMGK